MRTVAACMLAIAGFLALPGGLAAQQPTQAPPVVSPEDNGSATHQGQPSNPDEQPA